MRGFEGVPRHRRADPEGRACVLELGERHDGGAAPVVRLEPPSHPHRCTVRPRTAEQKGKVERRGIVRHQRCRIVPMGDSEVCVRAGEPKGALPLHAMLLFTPPQVDQCRQSACVLLDQAAAAFWEPQGVAPTEGPRRLPKGSRRHLSIATCAFSARGHCAAARRRHPLGTKSP